MIFYVIVLWKINRLYFIKHCFAKATYIQTIVPIGHSDIKGIFYNTIDIFSDELINCIIILYIILKKKKKPSHY